MRKMIGLLWFCFLAFVFFVFANSSTRPPQSANHPSSRSQASLSSQSSKRSSVSHSSDAKPHQFNAGSTDHWRDPQHLKVYLQTNNKLAIACYKQAIAAWNKTGLVHMIVTDVSDADISCITAHYAAQHKDIPSIDADALGMTYRSNTGEFKDSSGKLVQSNVLESAQVGIDAIALKHYPKHMRLVVAEHELGHALGLEHVSEDSNSVMVPAAGPHTSTITREDVSNLKKLYSTPLIAADNR